MALYASGSILTGSILVGFGLSKFRGQYRKELRAELRKIYLRKSLRSVLIALKSMLEYLFLKDGN